MNSGAGSPLLACTPTLLSVLTAAGGLHENAPTFLGRHTNRPSHNLLVVSCDCLFLFCSSSFHCFRDGCVFEPFCFCSRKCLPVLVSRVTTFSRSWRSEVLQPGHLRSGAEPRWFPSLFAQRFCYSRCVPESPLLTSVARRLCSAATQRSVVLAGLISRMADVDKRRRSTPQSNVGRMRFFAAFSFEVFFLLFFKKGGKKSFISGCRGALLHSGRSGKHPLSSMRHSGP